MNRRVDPKTLKSDQWSVAEAKARFSEVVARAKAGRPQRVTRYGKDEIVVVSAEAWRAASEPSGEAANGGSLLAAFEPFRQTPGVDSFAEILDEIAAGRPLQPPDPALFDE